MPILGWVLLGVFSTVTLISLLVFFIDESRRIHDMRGDDGDNEL